MADKDSLGPEALLQASKDCKYRLIRLLIDGGTQANVRNEKQETPLILACKSESEEKEKVVDYLIRKRVKVNLQDVHGKTALMYACLTNSPDNIIKMLVNSKANPWLVDETNNTAFDYAINAGNIGTVKVMIQACREGKILTKPGSFNIEMKRLEDRLDEMPEIRKWSWPLMGPRNSQGKEKRNTNLLAVSEVDELPDSPTRGRRRKRSICHFDPIELEENGEVNDAKSVESESNAKTLRKTSLVSASRSASEDERISLHFSDSDNSSFDRSSINFSSLEKLLRMRDSVTSSIDSNDSINAPNLQIKVECTAEETSPYDKISTVVKNTEATEEECAKEKDKNLSSNNDKAKKQDVENLIQSKRGSRMHTEKATREGETQETCAGRMERRRELTKEFEEKSDSIGQSRDELTKSFSALPCGMSGQNPVSPRVPRRRTVGSFIPSQKGDVIEDYEPKKTGNETEATRRATLGAMDMRSDNRCRNLNFWGEEHNFRPSPPPRDLLSAGSRKSISVSNSPEMKSFRKKIRSPEVDVIHSPNSTEIAQGLSKKLENTPDLSKSLKLDTPKSEIKANPFIPLNLPVISSPENIERQGNEEMGSGIIPQAEKTAVRRTLSDSVSQARRRASTTGTKQDPHGNGRGESASACVNDSTAGTNIFVTRERSSSFTPLSTTSAISPPRERRTRNNSQTCDIVTMTTTPSNGEILRSHSPRNKLSSDLPDLVLHTPRSRVRSPTNLDPFSLAPELQVSDPIFTRYSRSASPSSETLNPTGSQSHLIGSHSCAPNSKSLNSSNQLPEVVSSTTGSPKQKRVAFLPPLNIVSSRKQQDQPEEGYFSCSPSPLDLESPSRSKEKLKYSFKPSSPRLMNRPVKNLLP